MKSSGHGPGGFFVLEEASWLAYFWLSTNDCLFELELLKDLPDNSRAWACDNYSFLIFCFKEEIWLVSKKFSDRMSDLTVGVWSKLFLFFTVTVTLASFEGDPDSDPAYDIIWC